MVTHANILFNISCNLKCKITYVCSVTELLALLSTSCSVTKRKGWFEMKKTSDTYSPNSLLYGQYIHRIIQRCSSVRSGNSLGDLDFEVYHLQPIVFSQYLMYSLLAESTWKLVARSSVLNQITFFQVKYK